MSVDEIKNLCQAIKLANETTIRILITKINIFKALARPVEIPKLINRYLLGSNY
jgi:hypothetical protein